MIVYITSDSVDYTNVGRFWAQKQHISASASRNKLSVDGRTELGLTQGRPGCGYAGGSKSGCTTTIVTVRHYQKEKHRLRAGKTNYSGHSVHGPAHPKPGLGNIKCPRTQHQTRYKK